MLPAPPRNEELAAAKQKGWPIGHPFYYDHGIDREWIRIGGYLFSVSERGQKLFHVLMLGQSRYGKTLLDCNRRYWESAWPHHARIKPVINLYKASDYVSRHFMGYISQHTEADSFNRSLLRQVMRRYCGFIDNFDGLATDVYS